MLITRTSAYSQKTRTKDIDCTPEQLQTWMDGEHIQNVMPHLPAHDREFIMTGITQEEWDEMALEDEE